MAGVDRRLCAYGGAACTGQRAYVGTLVSRLPPRPEIQRARSACVIRTLRVRARAKRSGCATVAQARRRQCGVSSALLILAPRHPQRFDEVAALLKREGWRAVRRTAWAPVQAEQMPF